MASRNKGSAEEKYLFCGTLYDGKQTRAIKLSNKTKFKESLSNC